MAQNFIISKILIAIEDSTFSEKAAEYGLGIATAMNASIALVHVNNIPPATTYTTDPLTLEPPVLMPDLMFVQEESGQKLLDKYAADFESKNLTVFTFNRIGDTRNEILATAEEWGADLIVLGTHGRTGFDHLISGSVAESVTRHSKCPVLVVPNKPDKV
ncbi:universal stress protein [Pedobacter sp. HMF7647]|uniref:Universal stress protein n=1 Tax=Hufsiella arboris TaxID=2695275 RepID=A0A7K1YEX8_9SPHI|nr:universal stress protein [Hufsiella arboris]MXV52598.1 universal stress protein [Hufsiella arboris]